MSLLVRPVLLANFSSSDDMFSGKLTERTERISCLLSLQYTTRSWLSSDPLYSIHPLACRGELLEVGEGCYLQKKSWVRLAILQFIKLHPITSIGNLRQNSLRHSSSIKEDQRWQCTIYKGSRSPQNTQLKRTSNTVPEIPCCVSGKSSSAAQGL